VFRYEKFKNKEEGECSGLFLWFSVERETGEKRSMGVGMAEIEVVHGPF